MYTSQGKIDPSGLVDMIKEHTPLVHRLASQLITKLPSNIELDDLIQAGMIGLLDAARRFQNNQDAKFETYASQRIRGAMIDELRANDWVSRSLRVSSRSVARAVQAQEQHLGRAPTEAEVARQLELSLSEYQSLLQEIHGCQLVYYEDYSVDNEENSFLDQHTDGAAKVRNSANEPLEQMLESGLRQRLIKAIEAVPERERLLLGLYYEEDLTLREIGAVLEVGSSRVCQLHSQVISRLRSSLFDLA